MIVKRKETDEIIKAVSEVLHALPAWFGIEESIQEYCKESIHHHVWIEKAQNQLYGVLVGKYTSDVSMELYVMGVKEEVHHQGIGTALFQACKNYAIQHHLQFLQVKTIKEGCYDSYDQTNAFYQHLDFQKLECILALWDAHNPCQIYVMYIGDDAHVGD